MTFSVVSVYKFEALVTVSKCNYFVSQDDYLMKVYPGDPHSNI